MISVPVAKGHIDQRLTTEAEKIARGEKVEGRYLTFFLSHTGLPIKTVYSNVTELLLAGVDTVRTIPPSPSSPVFRPTVCKNSRVAVWFQISSTMSWSLYELSRHPELQASLRSEVLSALGGRRVAEAADVARMPLLKATVKEVLRYKWRGCSHFADKHLITKLNYAYSIVLSFSGCTRLFLQMHGSSHKQTSRLEATSSLKMWGNKCRFTLKLWHMPLSLCSGWILHERFTFAIWHI